MDYRSRIPCRDGVDCRFIRVGTGRGKCRYKHTEAHFRRVQRERNSKQQNPCYTRNTQEKPRNIRNGPQQYPNTQAQFVDGGFNVNPRWNQTDSLFHNNGENHYNNIRGNDHNHDQVQNHVVNGQVDTNIDHRRDRNYGQNRGHNRNNQENQRNPDGNQKTINGSNNRERSPQYDPNRRRKNQNQNNQRSPDYSSSCFYNQNGNRNSHQNIPINVQNHTNSRMEEQKVESGHSAQMQEEKRGIEHDLTEEQKQLMRQHLHEFCPPEEKPLNLNELLSEAEQSRQRLQQRRARQMRRLMANPNRRRYFYGNQRLQEENNRIVEQTRIENRIRQQLETFASLSQNYELDSDEYGADNNDDDGSSFWDNGQWRNFIAQDEQEDLTQNFYWFAQRNKTVHLPSLTHEQAEKYGNCAICMYEFSFNAQPSLHRMLPEGQQLNQTKLKQTPSLKVDPQQNQMMQLFCGHCYHKKCIMQWFLRDLKDLDHATCPQDRKDFRNHQNYSDYDENYLKRFIKLRRQTSEEQWRHEYEMMIARHPPAYLVQGRLQNVIERIEARQMLANEQRERNFQRQQMNEVNRRRQIHRNQIQQQSEQPEDSFSILYQSNHSQSSQQISQSGMEEKEERLYDMEENSVNPEQSRQFWSEYWKKKPQSNPFIEEQKEQQKESEEKKENTENQ